MSTEESEWCRLCGEHRKSHGKNLGKLIKRIRHKFVPEWVHKEIVYTEEVVEALKVLESCVQSGPEVYHVEEAIGVPPEDCGPSGPQPEFPLDELVTKDVVEPKIEYNYGLCKICEIPLTEEYEHVSFCGDCQADSWPSMMSVNKDEGELPN